MRKYITVIFCGLFFLYGCKKEKSDNNDLGFKKSEVFYLNDSTSQINLNNIIDKAKSIKGLKNLLVSKDGKLIIESYFEPYSKDSLDHVRSVTKSVIGLLIGIALDKNIIESIDEPISKYLSDTNGYKKHHNSITIRHLLTMTAGFNWSESASQYNQWVSSSDPTAYVLKRKMVNKPGEKFEYNSGVSHLLSVILTKASGITTLEFANRHLFKPLHIESVEWRKIDGYYNGGADLELKPRDMIKIGSLINNRGTFNGQQIVSKDWISASSKKQIQVDRNKQYSYQWWISPELPEANVMALGYRGQFIITLPESEAIIVATSIWRNIDTSSDGTIPDFFQLVVKDIYPYLKRE